jgi:hypothetical protein
MAKVEVSIPNLVSGQRYRMVVESRNNPSLVGPSIEFVVPPTPRFLSTYQPLYKVVAEPWSTTTSVTEVVEGATISAGSIQAEGPVSKTITGWKRGNNIYPPYLFTVSDIGSVSIGQTFTVNGMSSPAGGDYYDRLIYTVVTATGRLAPGFPSFLPTQIGATATIPSPVPSGFTTAWKNANGAPLVTNTTTSNNGTLNFTLPAIPATDQKATSTEKTTTTTQSGTKYHVDISAPQEISTFLISDETMFDAIVFFYIKNGIYYYLNDTVMGVNPPSYSTKPSTILLTERNANIGGQQESVARDYRFTVARYEKQGSSWVGYWMQKDETYETVGPSVSRVIYSQSAVKTSG